MIEVTPSESGITVVIGSHSGSTTGGGYSTPAEVKTAYESNADTNAFTDALKAILDFISVTQNVDLDQMESDIAALANGMVYKGDWDASSGSFPGGGAAQTGWFYYVSVAGTVDGVEFAVGDNIVAKTDNASTATYASNWSKHDQTDAVQSVAGLVGSITAPALRAALNIEDGATADQTGAEIKSAYEAEANTNAFTDTYKTLLDFISVTQNVDLDQMESDIAALANGMVYKGDWDASSGSFPGGGAAQTGWFYYVSVAGTVDGVEFAVGDNIVAKTDNASTVSYASNWSKHDQTDAVQSVAGLVGSITASALRVAINVEDGATADQTGAEIVTLYNSQVAQVSAGEIIAGTETAVRRFSPKDVADIAATHGGGGGGAYGDSVPLEIGDAADLSLEHDGTNSKVTSITGDLIFDNQNSIGSTEFHLGSDSSTTELNVKDDSGNNLFNVIGDGTVNIGSATKDGTLCIESYAGLWQTFKRGGVSIANLLYSSNGIALNTLVASRPFGINYRGTNVVTFKESIDYILFQNRAVTMPEFTTTVRDTLSVPAGTMIWNSTNTQLEIYNGASWAAV